MNGIRTYFRKYSAEPGFQQSYRCLYPLLTNRYFVETILGDCFHFPWDDDHPLEAFSAASLQSDGKDGLYDVSVLIANDRHISDDWNRVILLDIPDLQRNRTLADRIQSSSITTDEIRSHRIIFFHNFDGAFWQFFTNDNRFIASMLAANRNNPDLDLRNVEYQKDFPDPGEYREDYPPAA